MTEPYDFSAQRLFVDSPLHEGAVVEPNASALNYLRNVLRLAGGDEILLFNGADGEWRAVVETKGRRDARLIVRSLARAQTEPADLDYVFAPLKHARLDYMAQKAVEMGAGRLRPVLTRRTQARRVNVERLRANAIEAAEQCGVLSPPEVAEPVDLERFCATFPADRLLIFCDEAAHPGDAFEALRRSPPRAGVSVLIGPEGGFDPSERALLLRMPLLARLWLGPRILRADTAAVAALTLAQAALGDWRAPGDPP